MNKSKHACWAAHDVITFVPKKAYANSKLSSAAASWRWHYIGCSLPGFGAGRTLLQSCRREYSACLSVSFIAASASAVTGHSCRRKISRLHSVESYRRATRPKNVSCPKIQVPMASVRPVESSAGIGAMLADGQNAPSQAQQNTALDATLAARQAQISSDDMAAVRARLTLEESVRCPDQIINQFLRATVSNVDQAVKRLQETLEWRRDIDVESITCSACLADPRAHYMHPVGFDRLGRPVLYSCLQLAANRSVEDNRKHMIATFEQAIRLMKAPVEQWVWVSDFHGFGFSDLNPRIADTFLDLSAKHYPERLGAFLVVGAPFIFNGLWSVVQPLVDSATRKKIHMLSYDNGSAASPLSTVLHEFFPDELAQWLLKEMGQNRNRSLESQKVYPYKSPGAASSGTVVDGHDMRGPAGMLVTLQLQS